MICMGNRLVTEPIDSDTQARLLLWQCHGKGLFCYPHLPQELADADYLVQTKINDAKIQVHDAIQSVSGVLAQLKTTAV